MQVNFVKPEGNDLPTNRSEFACRVLLLLPSCSYAFFECRPQRNQTTDPPELDRSMRYERFASVFWCAFLPDMCRIRPHAPSRQTRSQLENRGQICVTSLQCLERIRFRVRGNCRLFCFQRPSITQPDEKKLMAARWCEVR